MVLWVTGLTIEIPATLTAAMHPIRRATVGDPQGRRVQERVGLDGSFWGRVWSKLHIFLRL